MKYEYLCYVDGCEMPDCSLDNNEPENCSLAAKLLREGKTKTDCEYWRKVPVSEEESQIAQLTAEIEVLRKAIELACKNTYGWSLTSDELFEHYLDKARQANKKGG